MIRSITRIEIRGKGPTVYVPPGPGNRGNSYLDGLEGAAEVISFNGLATHSSVNIYNKYSPMEATAHWVAEWEHRDWIGTWVSIGTSGWVTFGPRVDAPELVSIVLEKLPRAKILPAGWATVEHAALLARVADWDATIPGAGMIFMIGRTHGILTAMLKRFKEAYTTRDSFRVCGLTGDSVVVHEIEVDTEQEAHAVARSWAAKIVSAAVRGVND